MLLIVTLAGRFLLHHRDDRPDVVYPGHWAGFGGAVEPGETPEDALVRELFEETGLELSPGEAHVVAEVPDPVAGRLVTVALLRREVSVDDVVLGEGQGVALFDPAALAALAIPPFLRAVIDAAVLPDLVVG